MKQISVAIVGAGISGLTFASQLSRSTQYEFKLYEKMPGMGGRIFSPQVDKDLSCDLGANIIDFVSKEQEHNVRTFLSSLSKDKSCDKMLNIFEQPFLIYQNNQLRNGDYHKDRYSYKGGFNQLLRDITASVDPKLLVFNCDISRIDKHNQKWILFDSYNCQIQQQFDYMVLALDGPACFNILNQSKLQKTQKVLKLISETSYTTQISAAFKMNNHQPFSCILFKDHPLTFISSHEEKYPYSSTKIATIQMNEQFSLDNYGESEEVIEVKIRKEIPEEMREWMGAIVNIKRWKTSLIKAKKQKQEVKTFSDFQLWQQNLLVIGDISYGNSRVPGAIETALWAYRDLYKINEK